LTVCFVSAMEKEILCFGGVDFIDVGAVRATALR
jgi:hypothetical protein